MAHQAMLSTFKIAKNSSTKQLIFWTVNWVVFRNILEYVPSVDWRKFYTSTLIDVNNVLHIAHENHDSHLNVSLQASSDGRSVA